MLVGARWYRVFWSTSQHVRSKFASCGGACREFHNSSRHRFALLIDGDRIGPASWSTIIDKLRIVGDVAVSRVFVPPGMGEKTRWQAAARSSGVEVVNVPRRRGGIKNPNDIAIALEAARLGTGGDINGIALAVTDIDFVYMAERLRSWGLRVVVLMQEEHDLRLASAFQEAKAEIIRYPLDASNSEQQGRPKFKALLHLSGESTFESHHYDGSSTTYIQDEALIISTLRNLGYMERDVNPVIPAIAKFFYTNAIGPLTVWPEMYPRVEAYNLFAARRDEAWKRSTRDLVFVSPRANKTPTPHSQQRYGSVVCGSVVRGGGPFILKDSEKLVVEVLKRLGYMDYDYNSDLGEAIHVFGNMGSNHSNLASLGVDLSRTPDVNDQMALLRTALLSPEAFGVWRIAPSDKFVRQKLFAKNLLSREVASKNEVFTALQVYVRQLGLVPRKTYNGLLSEVLAHLAKSNPTKRV